jgi:hypothetical protein
MDLVGPARVCSAGGKRYVLVIVDDYSRYAWVSFLVDKGETFGFVRDLISRLKNERHGDVVRAIHNDNGSEFKNSHFETFCRDLGLEHQFSSPYVACQNGVVERKNCSLCEMAQMMLDGHDGNQIFLRASLNKTCYELMHGRAPRVSHFRAFGCRCFILKKGRLDKFESRSPDGIFLGYASHSRAFHVLNLDTNLVMETSEVSFEETQPCNSFVFECVGDDEVGKKIFEGEEDDAGKDDSDDSEALATHVPSTSTTMTTVQDGPFPTPPTSSKIKWKQLLRGRLSLGERHRGTFKLITRPQESSATSMSVRHGRGPEMLLTLLIQLLLLPLS